MGIYCHYHDIVLNYHDICFKSKKILPLYKETLQTIGMDSEKGIKQQ